MIWEPFVLALFLGLIVSAGLYFAYLWPSVEPTEEPVVVGADVRAVEPPAMVEGEPSVADPSVAEPSVAASSVAASADADEPEPEVPPAAGPSAPS